MRNAPTALQEIEVQEDITITGMSFRVNLPSTDPSNVTLTLRVNNVDTALSDTQPGTTTSFSATGSIDVSAGDLISVRVTKAGSTIPDPENVIGGLSYYRRLAA